MLEISALSVAYAQHRALSDAALSVGRGEIVVILGANGAGKTSLMKAIAGIVPSLPGKRIDLAGRDLSRLAAHEIVEAGLASVPEGRGIFGELTVAENLLLGANPRRARDGEAERRQQVLSLFPRLNERLTQMVRTMSGGEQQMVAIGRALMSNPDILLLDEPSLGLSPLMVRELFAALRKVRETGVGIAAGGAERQGEPRARRSRLSDRERQDRRQRQRRTIEIRPRRAARLSRAGRRICQPKTLADATGGDDHEPDQPAARKQGRSSHRRRDLRPSQSDHGGHRDPRRGSADRGCDPRRRRRRRGVSVLVGDRPQPAPHDTAEGGRCAGRQDAAVHRADGCRDRRHRRLGRLQRQARRPTCCARPRR